MRRCLVLLVVLAGCDKLGGGKPVDVAPIAAEDESLKKNESELIGQRGALQRERKKLSDARTELVDRRKLLGHDSAGQSAIDEEEKKLLGQESDLASKETEINSKLDDLLKQRGELVKKVTAAVASAPGADPLERAARREQGVATREKETCGGAAAPAVPIEFPKGLKYSAHDVEPIYKKALKLMQEHGLLPDDLGPGSGRLVNEVREAMKKGDYVRAKYDADALLAAVEEIKVDRGFISTKMARLAAAMRGHKLEGERRRNVEQLFQDATAAYGDGKFPQANTKINTLFSLLK